MKFGKNNCPHDIADIAAHADGLCPLCQKREIEELKAADRDHLSATNGMRTRLNDEIRQLRGQIEAARRAFHGTALMMRGVDSWPKASSIVGHVDCDALREIRIALGLAEPIPAPVSEVRKAQET